MTIGVVILNWNGIQLLKQFLEDVVNFSTEATIYVADNASTDASVKFIKANFPEVTVIENQVNGGYAKGYNDALAHVKEDIFILLNSDVQVTPHWLEPIVAVFKQSSGVAAVQPKILDYNNPSYFEYAGAAGGYIDKFGYPFCRGRIFNSIEKDEGQYDDETEIFWASGACLAVRQTAFYEAGGFDEDYFAHQEEIDFCWRLQNLGYTIRYTPQSIIYHVGGATLSSMNPQKTFYNFRNSLFNLVKNVPSHMVFQVVFVRMILDGIAALRFLIRLEFNHFRAVFRAHRSFYKQLLLLLRKRKKLPKTVRYFSEISVVCTYFFKGINKYSKL